MGRGMGRGGGGVPDDLQDGQKFRENVKRATLDYYGPVLSHMEVCTGDYLQHGLHCSLVCSIASGRWIHQTFPSVNRTSTSYQT